MLRITQMFLCYIFHIPFRIFFNPKIVGVENIPMEPFILVANHTSKVDPFLLFSLPLSALKKLLPVYFLTTPEYYHRWYLRNILKLIGSYPVVGRAWTMEEYLSSTIEKIEAGRRIMFFPEGGIAPEGGRLKPKTGIGYLVRKTGRQILPLHISWEKTHGIFKKRAVLSFGAPILPDYFDTKLSYQDISSNIMEEIYSL